MATEERRPRVGVLALQGDVAAHMTAVTAAGGDAVAVKTLESVLSVDALILPGGESTTIGKLMARFGVDVAIKDAAASGKPIFGTCAGLILLAKRIVSDAMDGGQPTLGLLDVGVERNAFGRQVDSFETELIAPEISSDAPLRAVFIRAPVVADIGPGVQTLASVGDRVVLVRQGNLLGAAFHPELTDDTRLHRYFLEMIPPR